MCIQNVTDPRNHVLSVIFRKFYVKHRNSFYNIWNMKCRHICTIALLQPTHLFTWQSHNWWLAGRWTYEWFFVILEMQIQWWGYYEVVGTFKPYLIPKSLFQLFVAGCECSCIVMPLLVPEPRGETFTIFYPLCLLCQFSVRRDLHGKSNICCMFPE